MLRRPLVTVSDCNSRAGTPELLTLSTNFLRLSKSSHLVATGAADRTGGHVTVAMAIQEREDQDQRPVATG